MTLPEKLQNLPDEPGVYLMKDHAGHIIYVGKAVSLKSRVRSYFQKSAKDEKTEALVRIIADLETIVTHTELEALILESTLIKKHHPRFNIILRDDKNYPYLRLDLKAEYPRLDVVRGLKKDGAVYYGPYVPAGGMWEILSLIRRTFPLATCRKEFNREKPERPCVQHQIGRCMAPCAGDVDPAVYKDVVSQVRLFIEGKNRDLVEMLKQRMEEASERMEFERAAELRDRIARIEGAFEKQKIISPGFENQDVIGIATEGGHSGHPGALRPERDAAGQEGFPLYRPARLGRRGTADGFPAPVLRQGDDRASRGAVAVRRAGPAGCRELAYGKARGEGGGVRAPARQEA